MKSKITGHVMLFITCVTVGMVSFASFTKATPFDWDWEYVSSAGTVTVKANGDELSSSYSGATFTGGLALWNDSAARVSIANSDYSVSNADFYSVEEDVWEDNGWGNGTAWTQPFRSDGEPCAESPAWEDPDDVCGGYTVNYAGIYFNEGNIISSSKRKAAIAHELGHVMGLDHQAFITEKDESLMTQGLAGGLVPSDYDIYELNLKY